MRDADRQSETHRHRSARKSHSDLPGADRVQPSLWRVAAVVGLAVVAMLAGLRMAVTYAERDWAAKNAAAHATGERSKGASEGGEGGGETGAGWAYGTEGRGAAGLRAAGRPGKGRASWAASAVSAARNGDERAARMAIRLATACGGDWSAAANLEGTLALEAGRLGEARRQFRSAAGANRSAAYNLALCDWMSGRRDEAISGMAAFAMRRDADDGALRTLGRWLWQGGRRDEAVDLLRRRAGRESPALLDLATYEAWRGEKRAAVATLERAMDGVPLTQVIHTYQSPAFREASLTEEGRALLAELAARARQTLGARAEEGSPTERGAQRRGAAGAWVRR